jgi:hypothetical protein
MRYGRELGALTVFSLSPWWERVDARAGLGEGGGLDNLKRIAEKQATTQ